ncbi:MAG: hypothetical protein HKN40_06015 [Winogradskyella sp.]|uniref:hypothetical protein n=1 Tax=Winogradskyella sp. TaxID=1883156 RepID=UPI00179A6092|nr:hypothetical protein [Winogradskyella sp.]
MRKLITLCLFVFAMILGTESATAQNIIEINNQASVQTETLRKLLKFDSDQRDQVYNAYKEYGKARANLVNSKTVTNEAVTKLRMRLTDKIESILNEQQFEGYKAYIKEQQG